MKFTLSRLFDFLDTNATLNEIAQKLNDLGLEVEQIDDPAARLGAFRVGEIISAEQHPNADRLRVCKVQTHNELLQIVCGAPNARAGIKVCVSVPGMYIPGLDITIKKGTIRDVDSCGMLCSADELGLEAIGDQEGILELPETAPIGASVIDVLGYNDPVIDIAVTPNRPDALGVYGIAKDLAAAGLGQLKPLTIPDIQGTFKSPIEFKVTHAESCPHVVGYYIKGVKIGDSPENIKKFLKAVGCKSINNAVDVTNYMCYSFARPLHVFDADKIGHHLLARLAYPSEQLETLDEATYSLEDQDIVIADENGPLAIAGVMGGLASGVYSDTVNIFLESAYFNPDYVAKTGRRLNLLSDARYRFERGIDPSFTEDGAKIAAQMIQELCGGEISEVVLSGAAHLPNEAYHLHHEAVSKLTGLDISFEHQEEILKKLGFTVINQGKKLICVPPASRPDIHGEADLVEEIMRIYGINHIKPVALARSDRKHHPRSPAQERIEHLKDCLSQRGFLEAVTYSFTQADKAALFVADSKDVLSLENPISTDLSDMCPTRLCGLLAASSKNQARGIKNSAIFEVGRVFHGIDADAQPIQAALLKTGTSTVAHWSRASEDVSIYDIKADILRALEILGAPVSGLNVVREAPHYYHPGRSAALKLGKNIYGYFGELHPKIAKIYDLTGRPLIAEILIDSVPLPKVKKSTALSKAPIHSLQPVQRDFAFIVDQSIEAETLLRAIRKAEKKLIEQIDIFDIFTGGTLEAHQKSIALRVTLQPKEKSLVDQEIKQIMDQIISEVTKVGATLR